MKKNRKKGVQFISLVLVLHAVTFVEAQKIMTLKECIETGIEKNFDVEERRIAEETEKINYKQAKLNLLPDLNGQTGYSTNQGRSIDPFTNSPVTQSFNSSSYSLSSGVVLFNGLSRINALKQAAFSWQASGMELQQQKDNLSISIILAYLQVLSLTEQMALSQAQAGLSAKEAERLDMLNKEGAIKPSDLSDLKGQYANDQLLIAETKNNLETARLSLFRLMNIPYDASVELEQVSPETFIQQDQKNSTDTYAAALKELAIVKAVDLRILSAKKALQSARGAGWPTLSLGGSAYTQYSSVATQNTFVNSTFQQTENYVSVNGQQYPVFNKQDNFTGSAIPYGRQLNNNLNTSLNLTLSIPVFNALRQHNKIKQAQLAVKHNEIIAADTKRQLQQDIDLATLNLETAIEKYKTLLEQVNAYQESFGAAETRFNEGVGNSIDYLTAKNNLDRSKINLVNARYDYVLRNKILNFYRNNRLW